MSKLSGRHLLGFSDFFESVSVGVTPLDKKLPSKKLSGGKVSPGKGGVAKKLPKLSVAKPGKGGKSAYIKSAVNSINAGKKALAASKSAEAKVKTYMASVKAGKHAPLLPVTVKKTHVGYFVVGAAPGVARILTPTQTKAVDKHTSSLAAHAMATKRLNIAASKARKAGKDALDTAGKTAAWFKSRGKKGGKSSVGADLGADLEAICEHIDCYGVGGLSDEQIGAVCSAMDMLGEDLSTQGQIDPATGLPLDSSVDPSLASSAGVAGVDPYTGIVTDMNGNVVYDPSQDPDVLMPPEHGGKLSQADAMQVYHKVPEDAIVWDGSQRGINTLGSVSSFYGPQKDGFGKYGPVYGYHSDGWEHGEQKWTLRFGQADITGNDNRDDLGMDDAKAAAVTLHQDPLKIDSEGKKSSTPIVWGPLIGNPNSSLAGLQYAYDDGKWFWQTQNAPAWAAAEADAKIMLSNNKTVAAKTAAALAVVAQQQKDAADLAEQQAKQLAQQALAQQAAEAQQTLAQTQADTANITAQQSQQAQMTQADIDYQKQQDAHEAAKNQWRLERAKQQAAQDAEAQHEMVAEAAVMNDYLKSHPEAMQQVMQAQLAAAQEDVAPRSDDPFADGGQIVDLQEDEVFQYDQTPEGEAPSMFEEGSPPQDEPVPDDL